MKRNTKKIMAIILAVVLLVGAVVGGTVAWLTDTTQTVQNTFTVGNIDITLAETDTNLDTDGNADTNDYKMIPGHYVTKDPKVTVIANSEKCWLFVKLDKSANFGDFMTYEMADGWTELAGATGVYYREVDTNAADQSFGVIKDNKVNILDTVTKQDMDALTTETYPKLNVTAYAVQYMKNNDERFEAADAWAIVNP